MFVSKMWWKCDSIQYSLSRCRLSDICSQLAVIIIRSIWGYGVGVGRVGGRCLWLWADSVIGSWTILYPSINERHLGDDSHPQHHSLSPAPPPTLPPRTFPRAIKVAQVQSGGVKGCNRGSASGRKAASRFFWEFQSKGHTEVRRTTFFCFISVSLYEFF